jgi:hypothetical protein
LSGAFPMDEGGPNGTEAVSAGQNILDEYAGGKRPRSLGRSPRFSCRN